MALIAWQATVQDDEGNIIVNPSITVRRASDNGLADIFDAAGNPLDNPFIGSSEGFVQFFAGADRYLVQGARGGSVTQTWTVDLVSVGTGQPYPNRAAAVAAWATRPASVKRVSWIGPDGAVYGIVESVGSSLPGLADAAPAETPSSEHFGGSLSALLAYIEGKVGEVSAGSYSGVAFSVPDNSTVEGDGPRTTTVRRTATGNLVTRANSAGFTLSGLKLDLDRTTLGDLPGHAVSVSGSSVHISDIEAVDYGSDGVGGGSGVLIFPATSGVSELNRLTDSVFRPDPLATISLGWMFEDTRYSYASRLYAHQVIGGIGYAHELKNDSQYNSLDQLIASDSKVALAYGQTTAGIDGCDYNVATNIVAAKCDQGLLIGEGFGNVTVGLVHDANDSPNLAVKRGIQYTGGAVQNYSGAVSTFGNLSQAVLISGSRNTVEINSHDTSAIVAQFQSGSQKNFINVTHPGTRVSVRGNITDNSGQAINGANANVVHSPVTGERIGSVQGRFWDKLGDAGVVPPGSHNWVYESGRFVFQSMLTPGNRGDIAGLAVSTGRDGQNSGRLWHVTGPTVADNYWTVGAGGSTEVFRIYNNHIRHGASGPRWHSGLGSPEGVIAAPVGSFYSRTDGGAGTSFYVKESGTGNTGWVAK